MASFRRAKSGQILTGLDDVDALLKEMHIAAGNRAARSGLTAACRLGLKLTRKKVPSTKKSVKKALGFRVAKEKGGDKKGMTRARYGAAVGMPKSKVDKRKGRKGVGMTSATIHWWIMGTKRRTIKNDTGVPWPYQGMDTGSMPASPIIKSVWNSNRSQIEDVLRKKTLDAINREWDKFSKKGRW